MVSVTVILQVVQYPFFTPKFDDKPSTIPLEIHICMQNRKKPSVALVIGLQL